MKIFQRLGILAVTYCLSLNGYAEDKSTTKLFKLTDQLYKIEYYSGYESNSIVSIGKDGLLLVDTGFKKTAKQLQTELKKLGNANPAYIITTHQHTDHTGGNYIFGQEPVIIGHINLRKRMLEERYILEEYPDFAVPELTFSGAISLQFNGEEIRIIAIEGGHTDNDIMVHFTKSGYAYLGDDAYGLHIPSHDGRTGNSSLYAKAVKKGLDQLPDDTKFISGHGRDLNMTEMREWQAMLEQTTEIIHQGMKKGLDIKTMQSEKILSPWEKYATGGYVSSNAWIKNVVNGFNGTQMAASPLAQYYKAFHQNGVEAVISSYFELRNNHSDEYFIHPVGLYNFVYYLLDNNKTNDAIKLLEFSIEEFSELTDYFYDALGEAYWQKGDKENAIKNYNLSLKIDPSNENAIRMLSIINKQ